MQECDFLLPNFSDAPEELKQPSLEMVNYDQDPETSSWSMVPLYLIAATKKPIVWKIWFISPTIYMERGEVGGKMVVTDREIKLTTRSFSLKSQALQEMRRRYENKVKKGYKAACESPTGTLQAMKADKYVSGKTKINWPVAAQPKLNGIRLLIKKKDEKLCSPQLQSSCEETASLCHASVHGDTFEAKTYIGTIYKHLVHLYPDLERIFSNLPEGATLDGELYIHGTDLYALCSIVKSVVNIHQDIATVGYHIFDVVYESRTGAPFEERRAIIQEAFENSFSGDSGTTCFLTPTYLVASEAEAIALHDYFVSNNYEGAVLKKLANGHPPGTKQYEEARYRPGKNHNTVKLKAFFDEEGLIIDVKEGEGTEKGAAIFKVINQSGATFSLRPAGTFEERRKYFGNPASVIGKRINYTYREISPDGVPVMAVGRGFREDE